MSEVEERMEGVENTENGDKIQPDVEALKASAREIVEKAGQNGASDHADYDQVNGSVEHDDEKMEADESDDVTNGEGDSNGASASADEKQMKEHTVNGNGADKAPSAKAEDGDEEGDEVDDDEAEESGKNGDADKSGDDENDKNAEKSDSKETEDNDKSGDSNESGEPSKSGKEKGNKTPKKKKRVEEVSLDDSPPLRRSSRKKTPTKYAELEKDIEFVVEDNDMDIQEIRDDDSDIQEVEPEDPLGGATISITKSTKSNSGKKPSVVTIDDLKTLQRLATSAKKNVDDEKKEKLTIIDTQAILAGKMGSGVSITPAKPRSSLNITSLGLTLGSGVTIKPNTPKPLTSSVTITSTSTTTLSSSPAQKEESYDPNLTDDTFVVEAPSFIVPYVYEKPPKEGIKDFKASIEKLQKEADEKEKEEKEREKKVKEEEKAKRREERQKKRDNNEEVEDDTEDEKEEEEVEADKEESKDSEKKEDTEEKKKEEKESYFTSLLGKFFMELGMNLVQEYVQKDLLHQQKRRAHKDKSAAVMHAIMSLQKNLDDSKDQNAIFHHDLRKCKFCSFRTESRVVMQHHMETPHMKNFIYRCNFCEYETKIPQEVLFHMDSIHGVKGKLERAPYFHQCPQCPFEDNGKGKLTRHKLGCDKRFKSELNQQPERDWDPPAKIKPQPIRPGYGTYNNYLPGKSPISGIRPGQSLLPNRNFGQSQRMQMMNSMNSMNSANSMNRGQLANRGRPVGSYKGPADLRIPTPGGNQQNKIRGMSPQMLASQQMLAALNSQGLSVYGSSGKNSPSSKVGSPSISITPLPGRTTPGGAGKKGSPSPSVKPGQPGAGQGKGNFVICEICDGYIKDLEQLRNHMQWIHKVKIHPKMIYNRPPLNCQKCQFRFFTDQGLERHLLGSHGLVTASMQDAANKGQDSGRCPVCGKVYQWKLLNHVAKDHNKTLKPAHLSYKCTVCTATFGQYKLFENHVYTAHSGVAKKADKAKQAAAAAKQGSVLKPGVKPGQGSLLKNSDKSKDGESEVIDLEDEEEIDDVEKEVIDLETPKKSKDGEKRELEDGDEPEKKKVKASEEEKEEEKDDE